MRPAVRPALTARTSRADNHKRRYDRPISLAVPEPSERLPAEHVRAGRLLVLAFAGCELAWVAGLSYLLIRVLLLG